MRDDKLPQIYAKLAENGVQDQEVYEAFHDQHRKRQQLQVESKLREEQSRSVLGNILSDVDSDRLVSLLVEILSTVKELVQVLLSALNSTATAQQRTEPNRTEPDSTAPSSGPSQAEELVTG